jgi:hypothetical protein
VRWAKANFRMKIILKFQKFMLFLRISLINRTCTMHMHNATAMLGEL